MHCTVRRACWRPAVSLPCVITLGLDYTSTNTTGWLHSLRAVYGAGAALCIPAWAFTMCQQGQGLDAAWQHRPFS